MVGPQVGAFMPSLAFVELVAPLFDTLRALILSWLPSVSLLLISSPQMRRRAHNTKLTRSKTRRWSVLEHGRGRLRECYQPARL